MTTDEATQRDAARVRAHEVLTDANGALWPCVTRKNYHGSLCDRLVDLLASHAREVAEHETEMFRQQDRAVRAESELATRNRELGEVRAALGAVTAERDALLGRKEVCRVHAEGCTHGRRVGSACLHCGGRASK